jgi:plasmid stabilization system protein ParE
VGRSKGSNQGPTLTWRLTVRPEAFADLAHAYEWYESQSLGVGEAFLAAFEACVSLIERMPEAFPQVEGKVRKSLIRKFPYLVLFEVEKETVDVIAVFHSMQNPKRWRGRF